MGLIHYVKLLENKSNYKRYNFLVDKIEKLRNTVTPIDEYPSLGIHLERCKADPSRHIDNSLRPQGLINIIIPSDQPRVVGICCNYDAATGSAGANDNASGVAVMLDLVKRFHDFDLEGRRKVQLNNIGVEFYFVCNGASDSMGSKDLASELQGIDGSTPLIGVYNLKLVGQGDRIVTWPLAFDHHGPLSQSLRAAVQQYNQEKNTNVKGCNSVQALTGKSDYVSFRNLGIESFVVSTATKKDLSAMTNYFKALNGSPTPEELVRHIDTSVFMRSEDTSDRLSEKTLKMVSDFMYRAILNLDQMYG